MREVVLTSSALILALLVLRRVFRRKISRRLQYALWGLVLLRLLIPVNLPAVEFSVLSVSEPVRTQVSEQIRRRYVLPAAGEPLPDPPAQLPEETAPPPAGGRATRDVVSDGDTTRITCALTLEEAMSLAWKTGMTAMAGWLLGTNLAFWAKLRRKRIPLELEGCKYPVYLMEEGLVSPCLFGLARPAVYLTPAAMADGETLRHVLAHEQTHARHGDPLWALLRSVCLAIYWFNPLVWWAAVASREDCELACDEGALERLDASERIPYGQTLLRLIPVQRGTGSVLLTATTMTSDKKRLTERITQIAENRKMKTAALWTVLAAIALVCAATFTGCSQGEGGVPDPPGQEAVPIGASAVQQPPAGKLMLTVPLTDLAPMEPVPVAKTVIAGHHADGHSHHGIEYRHGHAATEHCVLASWYDGDTTYVSACHEGAQPGDYFLCFPHQEYTEEPFTDLFGYDGVMIAYNDRIESASYYGTVNDYYVFEETADGNTAVTLLARMYGMPETVDLDGDGTAELISSDFCREMQIVFQRDGKLYEADVPALLEEYWAEMRSMDWCGWRDNDDTLFVFAGVSAPDGGAVLYASRSVCFDGENLLLYKPERNLADHMLSGIQDFNIVTDAAKAAAKAGYEQYAAYASDENPPPEWDDYCVTRLEEVYLTEPGQLPNDVNLLVYQYDYELHTTTPERVLLIGDAHVDEDGWVGGIQDAVGQYLFFQILEDGSYRQLDGSIPNDVMPASEEFLACLEQILVDNGLQ